MAIQTTESRGGERFVYRVVKLDVRETPRNRCCVRRKTLSKCGIDQGCVNGATAMMDEAGNRIDIKIAQPTHPAVGPRPIGRGTGMLFPKQWIPERRNSEVSEEV